ncbi:MAG: undecaprenyl/decaprenyl-phosphate alpha-N-acetylglucosaminyl 1-phosphate transferase, partial [Bifidobacteriaceae bacterium]|nr:undecaprenyl/decaprenyl-phosphate alpha-N-acetylglucosaminyl 1-phosphate transferase [Bifidobacteriaceae bacterium]
MKVYLLVCVISAVVTWALTPLVRRLARAWGAMTPVRDRDIHTVPTPRMGGVAMLGGIAVGMLVASRIGFLDPVFGSGNRSAWAVLGAAALVVVLGVVDDIWELDWLTKLAGQVLAAGLMAWQGVQLVAFPVGGLTITSSRFSLVVTILVVVVAINAVNFVDGLDGLAAGLVAIGGLALFTYVYLLSRASAPSYATLAGLLAALMVGACLGFLPHNFNPASIFMGDAGSMLLGLLFASATIAVTGQIDPGSSEINTRQALPAFLPILLPFAVLALPLLDMVMAVFRRLRAGQSPFHADRMHLHHRLLAIGHSQRRAVILMYVWTAVLAFPCA